MKRNIFSFLLIIFASFALEAMQVQIRKRKAGQDSEEIYKEVGLVNKKKKTGAKYPMHQVCRSGDSKAIKLSLENNPDFDINKQDDYGCTLLHIVCERGFMLNDELLVKLLLDKGADPSITDYLNRNVLNVTYDTKIIKRLLKKDSNLISNLYLGRYHLTKLNNSDLLSVLEFMEKEDLMPVGNFNIRWLGVDSICKACIRGLLPVVKLLFNSGGNIDIEKKDKDGLTLLDHARINNNSKIAQFLLAMNANPAATDDLSRNSLNIEAEMPILQEDGSARAMNTDVFFNMELE